ncbi:MAG: Co2+/Mg2+ efflux protein ApaG [Phycisphaerales bacterium]|nr:Co2+/Mg2+ efflux protein ApaG [Phycisphaerales bacterium]
MSRNEPLPQFPSRPERAIAPGPSSSLAVTRGVRVEAHPVYLNEQTDAEGHNHVFGYRILITNQSDQSVQVLGRRWVIIDGDGHRRDVEGDGVVGQQPVIEPGDSFEYASFCPLPTKWGTMEGSYLIEGETGRFWAGIARFYLVAAGE